MQEGPQLGNGESSKYQGGFPFPHGPHVEGRITKHPGPGWMTHFWGDLHGRIHPLQPQDQPSLAPHDGHDPETSWPG